MRPPAEQPLADRVRRLRLVAPAAPNVETHLNAIDRMVNRAFQRLDVSDPRRSDTLDRAA